MDVHQCWLRRRWLEDENVFIRFIWGCRAKPTNPRVPDNVQLPIFIPYP